MLLVLICPAMLECQFDLVLFTLQQCRDFYSAEYKWFNSCWSLSIFELSSETLLLRPFWMNQATLTVSHLNPNSSCSLGDGVLDPILKRREVIHFIEIKARWWYRSSIKAPLPTAHPVRVLSVVLSTDFVAPAWIVAMNQLKTLRFDGYCYWNMVFQHQCRFHRLGAS